MSLCKRCVYSFVFFMIPGVLALAMASFVGAEPSGGFSSAVTPEGEIRLPSDFRARFVHLGSWFVPEGDASGLHDVYAESHAVDTFRASGAFPDGAVLVKEVRAASSGNYTTGVNVHFANAELKQIFVMVKDTKHRFPEDPRWGEGWGWALFKPDDLSRNVAESYQSACLGCHLPARATDYVYREAYPTLIR